MSRKETAQRAFSTVADELTSLSEWMFENPEIANQEFESSRKLSGFLGGHGFAVTYPAYGLETAFAATVGARDPRVIICCEYDALPEVGHGCGHNIIATAALRAGVLSPASSTNSASASPFSAHQPKRPPVATSTSSTLERSTTVRLQ